MTQTLPALTPPNTTPPVATAAPSPDGLEAQEIERLRDVLQSVICDPGCVGLSDYTKKAIQSVRGKPIDPNKYVLVERTSLEAVEKENKRLTLKCRNSLANNLCPDHRDKQAGKPCLACEIERLRKDIQFEMDNSGNAGNTLANIADTCRSRGVGPIVDGRMMPLDERVILALQAAESRIAALEQARELSGLLKEKGIQ